MGVIVRTSKAPRAGLTFDGAQQIPTGFRNIELGLLPQEWSVRTLGELGQSLIGLTYDPQDIDPSGVLVLRSSNIGNNSLQFGDDVHVNMDIPNRMIARRDDLLICVRNGSRPLIGKCALIDERAVGMAFGAFMSVFRSADTRFVFHCFQSDIIKRQINEHLGATINQITNKSLNSFKIPYPERREREAITVALSDMDELLDALEALIAKKQDIKLGAMRQLLTGEMRLPGFAGPWERKSLGQLGSFEKGRGIKREDVSSSGLPCIRYGELYTRYKDTILNPVSRIPTDVAAEALAIDTNALLFAASGESAEDIGRCSAYIGEERAYVGGDIIVLIPVRQDSRYLGYLMNSPPVTAQKAHMAQGDAVVHIITGSLAQVQLDLPPLQEQTAIAQVLGDMDNEIVALEQRRAKTIAIKQGMMQELLTGRTRLI